MPVCTGMTVYADTLNTQTFFIHPFIEYTNPTFFLFFNRIRLYYFNKTNTNFISPAKAGAFAKLNCIYAPTLF